MTADTLDDLLREALADDLPAQVEAHMEHSLDAFVAAHRPHSQRRPGWRPLRELAQVVTRMIAWRPQPGLLAAASLLLALGAIAFHVVLGPSAFASSLARFSAGVTLAREVEHLASGGCRVVASTTGAPSCSINWLAPGETEATVRTAAGSVLVLRIAGDTASISKDGGPVRPLDRRELLAVPELAAVAELLAPVELANHMYRSWRLVRTEETGDPATTRLVFREDGSAALYDVTAAAETLRPRSIRKLRLGASETAEQPTIELAAELTCDPQPAAPLVLGGRR
jgi:hypothetical protein